MMTDFLNIIILVSALTNKQTNKQTEQTKWMTEEVLSIHPPISSGTQCHEALDYGHFHFISSLSRNSPMLIQINFSAFRFFFLPFDGALSEGVSENELP